MDTILRKDSIPRGWRLVPEAELGLGGANPAQSRRAPGDILVGTGILYNLN